MAGYVSFEKPFKITGPDGTVYYEGSGKFGTLIEAETAAGDVTGILSGVAAIVNSATVIAGPYVPVTEYVEKLVVARVAAATSVGLIGVALGTFAAVGGSKGILAGAGSIVAVRTTSAGIAVGAAITGSATAGLCMGDAAPLAGELLGVCVKANAQEGAGGYFAGVYVGVGTGAVV